MALVEARSIGLPAVAGDDPRVLILGSLPSVRSIAQQQYYAFPTNAFWNIMGALVGAGKDVEYGARLEKLKSSGIALWDSLASSRRPGSLDANIDHATAQPNDIKAFLAANAGIRLIAFNGRASQESFLRHIDRDLALTWPQINQVLLPSSSAAHASMGLDDKIKAWSVIMQYLDTN
ncbi:MAG: DNA-deoxyinosine glycosylase [Gammaproteobacteria bacterium]|nr:DNA-deoxyinosine glycosylase [Gammaproteobacteria bacterium]